MRRSLLLSLLALLTLLTGCATVGTFQSADTLGKGGRQFGLEPSIWWPYNGEDTPLPNVGMTARWGVANEADVGFRLGTSGLEILSKFGVVQGPTAVTVSVAPSVGGLYVPYKDVRAGVIGGQVPVLIGVNVRRHELVLSPKVHTWYLLGGEDREFAINLGGSVGFAFRLGKRVEIIPEAVAVVPVKSWPLGEEPVALVQPGDGLMLQGGVALLFGRYRPKHAK